MKKSTLFYRWLVFWCIGYLVFYWYIDTSHLWTIVGAGLSLFNPLILLVEIPLVVLISGFFFFPTNNNIFLRYFLPYVPLLVCYIFLDAFFLYLNRSASLSDLQNFGSIFGFSIPLALELVALLLCVPLSILLNLYWVKKNKVNGLQKTSIKVRILIGILLVWMAGSESFIHLQSTFFRYTVWSAEDTIRENGKLSSFIYYSNQERQNQKTLERKVNETKLGSPPIGKQFLEQSIEQTRNIHVVVLESFIDPRLIEQLALPQDVLAAELKPFLNDSQYFSHVYSPIYGGGTAQTEFELLTGIKALAKVNQIEFNVMKGGRINAFVEALKSSGFQVMGTIAPSSRYFNSKLAYKSLGINDIEYLQDELEKSDASSDLPIFDGDLFQHNLEKVRKKLSENGKPLFNYVLGMYGHMPFERNLDIRPNRFKLEHQDAKLTRISNQFYYRTKALASYLKKLLELDKNSIIYVTSDHLPSILNSSITYRLSNKSNIAIMLVDGVAVDVTGRYQYQIPSFIWSKLSANDLVNSPVGEKAMQEWYFKALSESLK